MVRALVLGLAALGRETGDAFVVVLTGDHSTPVEFGDHSAEPVPFTVAPVGSSRSIPPTSPRPRRACSRILHVPCVAVRQW